MSWDILPKSNLQYFLQKLKGKFDGKVDIVAGKGLSTNDYTTTEKNKLAGIESGAQVNPTIDSALSSTSTNAVQNKVVKSALDGKADNSEVTEVDTANSTPFLYRKTPYEADRVFLDELVGGSVAWNQLVQNGNFSSADYWVEYRATLSVSVNVATISVDSEVENGSIYLSVSCINGHKYYVCGELKSDGTNQVAYRNDGNIVNVNAFYYNGSSFKKFERILSCTANGAFRVLATGYAGGMSFQAKNYMAIDLTQMFGTTIADYIYSLEQATAGSGIAWLKSHGFFTKDYYPYNTGELISVKTSGKKYVGKNKIDVSPVTMQSDGYYLSNYTLPQALPVGTYTISIKSSSNAAWSFWVHDENGNEVGAASSASSISGVQSATFTTNGIGVVVGGYVNAATTLSEFMLESGSTPSPYEPYTETIYDISNIDLRGIPKLVNNELVYDGDTYESDGSVTRKYGIVDLGTLDWVYDYYPQGARFMSDDISGLIKKPIDRSEYDAGLISDRFLANDLPIQDISTSLDKLIAKYVNGNLYVIDKSYTDATTFKTAMSGVYLIYELATPTTETTDPFTNPQICDKDGTEEFIDNRTVPIPVGHNSRYANLPSMMDGDYLSYMARNFASEEYVDSALEEVDTELGTKVDKVTGKGLSTNDYTNEEKSLVETIPDKADADDVKSTQTATGNPITLTDASETYAESLVVELEPKQDLHGYDFPWVGGAGKNKVDISDKTLTQEGYVFNESVSFPSGTYTFSFETTTENVVLSFAAAGNGNTYVNGGVTKDGNRCYKSFTATDVLENIRLYSSGGGTFTKFQLEIAPTGGYPSEYEPYENICPISGYEGVEVEDVGDNLYIGSPSFDGFEQLTGNWTLQTEKYNDHDVYKRSDVWGGCYKLINLPVGTYTFSVMAKTNDGGRIYLYPLLQNVTTASVTPAQAYFDTSTSWHRYYYTFNVTVEGTVAFRVERATSGDVYISEYQLEKGTTTPTDYHPYQSPTASVTFGQTVYGGRSDFTEGGTSDEFENLDDFTDVVFHPNQGGTYAYEVYIGTPNKKYGVDNLIANEMPVKTPFTDVAEFSIRGFGNDSDIAIKFPKNLVNTPELAKQWCIDNGLQIVYEKATPTTISTPLTDLKLLQGTNNLTTNGTTITLDYIPNNSIGDAVKASEEYTDRAVERVAPKATLIDTWMISEESDTISVDLTSYDCNFFLLEYLFHSKRGTTLIPRPQGGSFSASVVTYYNGSALYIELDYNPTTKVLSYTSNITSQFGVLAIYTI